MRQIKYFLNFYAILYFFVVICNFYKKLTKQLHIKCIIYVFIEFCNFNN